MGDISSLDIDIDINANKRQHIFQRLKEEFGADNFLQVATFGTEASRSAVKTACRGLEVPDDVANYIASLIPNERGKDWTIKECLFGDESKGRKPVTQFIKEVSKYEGLKETILKIQGLISRRGTHAGGVIILNNHYTEQNALMRSPDGSLVTQYNLEDTQAMGAIKMDLLSLDALVKIQETFNYLLKTGEIKRESTLRETFYKYFHPDVIDLESKEIFELAGTGTVQDLFQFSTSVGYGAITKATPHNLIEMSAINSVMRLMNRLGEAPLETFARFKEDISLWYKEMKEYNLNDEEVSILEEHLLKLNGIADTQESAMLLSMDERIAGFNMQEATMLRKTIAGANEEKVKKLKDLFYSKGEQQGARKELLNYIWEVQIGAQLGYSFSSPHVLAYSLIAMLELNLNHHYNPIYWQTAVLNSNAGTIDLGDDLEKQQSKDYGKVAKAVSELQEQGVRVEAPLINTADYSFIPDAKNNRIIFSLKAITGLNEDSTKEIIEKRPYSSFEDFYKRVYEEGEHVKPTTFTNLIKAGAFSEFETPTTSMSKFILGEIKPKNKLNGQNMRSIIRLGLLEDPKYTKYKQLYDTRAVLNRQVHEKVKNPNDTHLFINDNQINFVTNTYGSDIIVGYTDDGRALISKKGLTNSYNKSIAPFYELANETEFIRNYNKALFLEEWVKRTGGGSVEKWNMDSLVYYPNKHELDYAELGSFGVVNFFDLEEFPTPIGYSEWNGRKFPQYQISTIAGTVIDKNNNKHTFTLLTKEGVVLCKLYSGAYAHYNKQIKTKGSETEESWFKRGTMLLVNGYRRGEQFVVKKAKFQEHSLTKILEVQSTGMLSLQTEK